MYTPVNGTAVPDLMVSKLSYYYYFVQIVSLIVQVSAGAYFFDWLPLLVVVILGWLFLRRGGVLRAADVDLLLLGDSLPGVSFCVIRHHFP